MTKITKFGHACVSLETSDGRRIVIDPGSFTDPAAAAGAAAIFVTHEHPDHFVAGTLKAAAEANPGVEIYSNASVAEQLAGTNLRVHSVGAGDAFEVEGFSVTVHGEWHADLHPEIPVVSNIGFLIDGSIFHPGDAFTVPGTPVHTLLTPVHAPWSRTAQILDWVREVGAEQTLAVHDAGLSEIGLGMVGRFLGNAGPGTGAQYIRLNPDESLSV